jgi:hypothetical protein
MLDDGEVGVAGVADVGVTKGSAPVAGKSSQGTGEGKEKGVEGLDSTPEGGVLPNRGLLFQSGEGPPELRPKRSSPTHKDQTRTH